MRYFHVVKKRAEKKDNEQHRNVSVASQTRAAMYMNSAANKAAKESEARARQTEVKEANRRRNVEQKAAADARKATKNKGKKA